MTLAAVISALVYVQTATAPAPAFQAPMPVAEPVRLAITPKLDGVIDDEEWDPLVTSPNLKGYFQWEPAKLHFAAVTANGNDLLVSIDFGSNGWLVGRDNIELRISNASGSPTFTVREMDATPVSGPQWVSLPGMARAAKVAAKSDAANTTYEFTLDDAGLGRCPVDPGSQISLRLDAIPATSPPLEPFLPRILTPVRLEYTRAAALPNDLKFGVENAGVYVPPGESARLRFTFNGTDKMNLTRLSLRGEGFARELADLAVPFPSFDAKGRAFVDYRTPIPLDASQGFRVVRGTLAGADGVSALLEASFRVAPPFDIELVRAPIRSKPQAQTVRLAYYIRCNAARRFEGESSVSTPPMVSMPSSDPEKFVLDGAHSFARMAFRLQIPAGVRGAIPVTFKVVVGNQIVNSEQFVNIE